VAGVGSGFVTVPLDQQARRIQAAQALGGYSSVERLAEGLAERDSRVKLKRLRALWRGEKPAIGKELAEIAGACDLPEAFFTVDFRRLDEIAGPTPLDAVQDEVRDLQDQVAALREGLAQLAVHAAEEQQRTEASARPKKRSPARRQR
jgi:hypothetical protein